MREKKPILEWGLNEDDLDGIDSHLAFEDLCDALTEHMAEINPSGWWEADVKNLGWRKLDGHKPEFEAREGSVLLRAILPRAECSFRIFRDRRGLRIQNYHHDSPTGDEWYSVYPRRTSV